MSVTVELKEMNAVIKRLRSIGNGRIGRRAKQRAIRAAGKQLERHTLVNISNTQYSLAQLEAMDHPYARRHGSIGVHPEKPYTIHRQSGTLSRSLVSKMKEGKEPVWRIGFKYASKRYFKYLITGTKVMLPRNVLYDTSQEEVVRTSMIKAVKGVLSKELPKE